MLHGHVWLHPTKKPIVELSKGKLEENTELPIDNDVYKVLGKFKPSSLNHKTIAKEIHHHLAKHGYYSHSDVHPLVRSPKDNEHLSHWGKMTSGRAKSEGWHSDSTGDKTQHDKTVGVWSTKHSTKIRRTGEHEAIKDASKPGHVTLFNDKTAQHKASGHHDRWFLRAHNIRKIPEHGLTIPGSKGKPTKHFEHKDIGSYVKAKKDSRDRFHENMKKWLRKNKKHRNYEKAHAFVKEHYGHLLKETVFNGHNLTEMIMEKLMRRIQNTL
jgi:hypothetical protein